MEARASPTRQTHTRRAAKVVASRRLAALCLPRVMPPSLLTDPEIAAQVVTMPPTAATHVTSLLAKLEATNRRHADDIAAHQALA